MIRHLLIFLYGILVSQSSVIVDMQCTLRSLLYIHDIVKLWLSFFSFYATIYG